MGAFDNLTRLFGGEDGAGELPTLAELGVPARSRLGRAAAVPGEALDAAENAIAAGAGAVAAVPGAVKGYLLDEPLSPMGQPGAGPQAPPPGMPTEPPPPAPMGQPQGTAPAPSRTVPAMEDVRAIRAKNASAIEGLKAGSGNPGDAYAHSRPLDETGDLSLAGMERDRISKELLDKKYGSVGYSRPDPMAEKTAADEDRLKWERLQPLGTQARLSIGSPGGEMVEGLDAIPEGMEAAPIGAPTIAEGSAARAAAAGVGGKAGVGALKPTDRRALSQDNMRAYYVGELDKLQRALARDVGAGKRTEEQAAKEYSEAERNAAFHISALGGDSTAGFFAKPDPYDVPLPAVLPPIGR